MCEHDLTPAEVQTLAPGAVPVPAALAPQDAGDTEALAEVLKEAHLYQAAHYGGWNEVAAEILASDWLATRDAALRAEGWDKGFKKGGDHQYQQTSEDRDPFWIKPTNPYRAAGGAL